MEVTIFPLKLRSIKRYQANDAVLEKQRNVFWDVTPCSPTSLPTFRNNVLLPYSGVEAEVCVLTTSCWLFARLFHPEDGASTFLRNYIELLPDYTASRSWLSLWEPDLPWALFQTPFLHIFFVSDFLPASSSVLDVFQYVTKLSRSSSSHISLSFRFLSSCPSECSCPLHSFYMAKTLLILSVLTALTNFEFQLLL